jgi:starch-binding outer membrane protein SusE/F
MKNNIIITINFITALLFAACNKVDKLPFYASGNDITLTASTQSITLTAADSANSIIQLNWTDPSFSVDSAQYKYVVQIDTAAAFGTPKIFTQIKERNKGFTGEDLNNMVIIWGGQFNSTKDIYVRIRGSYPNNNDMKISNVVKLTVTPVAMPFNLSASVNTAFNPTIANKDAEASLLSWTRPNIDGVTVTYSLEYDSATKNFANSKTVAVGEETFEKSVTNALFNTMADMSGISDNGNGKVDVRVKGVVNGTNQVLYSSVKTFEVNPIELIVYLYVAGDYQGWSPGSAPRIASVNGINYEGYIWVQAGGSGKFKMTSAPDWDHTNYGGSATTLDPNGGDLSWPSGTGKYYLLKANLDTKAWSAIAIDTWGVIGDGTPGGWDASTPLTYNTATKLWEGTITFSAGNFKFRANNGWDINLGGTGATLNYGGDNIPVTATGSKAIKLNLINPLKYTYTIQ